MTLPPADRRGCGTFNSDRRIYIRPPDSRRRRRLRPLGIHTGALLLLNPTLLFEVLSPSTRDYDAGAKREHYQHIPSLRQCCSLTSPFASYGTFGGCPMAAGLAGRALLLDEIYLLEE